MSHQEQPQTDAGEAPLQDHEELSLLLEDARSKADEHWNQCLRLSAEMDNLRKRGARDVETAHKFALEGFVRALLPVKDSLELGLASAGDDAAAAKLREGTELTLKMFAQTLEKFGVSEINPVGERFNPDYHQAMTTQESRDQAPDTVLSVYQKGYLLNERLVRPALVVVARAGQT
jgi:molecular chaperone GrpE